jgi:predicted dehydrogenase
MTKSTTQGKADNTAQQPKNSRQRRVSRREMLKSSSLAALAGASLPYWFTTESARAFYAANDRPVVGCIGVGDRWRGGIGPQLFPHGDVAAVCDVDANNLGKAHEQVTGAQKKPGANREVATHEDYRKVLDRKDIDVVSIVTPDHWHSKIAIEAMKAGKDVYCEKPLTLTIDEGKQIIKVLKETKRVFQVGTQQRSEMGSPPFFLQAVALAHSGRLGTIKKVQCAIGAADRSGKLPRTSPPQGLNWEMWLGQAPLVDYVSSPREKGYPYSRCHYEFRWWYEYSGGKMTDWGAHHIDIAQWAIGMDKSGPVSVHGTAEHPCPFKDGHPTVDDMYNAAYKFQVTCLFPNGVEMLIRDDTENGVLIEGTEGRIFVNRGKISGKPVEDLKTNPLPEDALTKLYKGKKFGNHMRNFFDCIVTREDPISDVYTHHRAMTTCHLANIAIRLGRRIEWDPETEQIVGDKDAQQWQAREQRKGYEIVV